MCLGELDRNVVAPSDKLQTLQRRQRWATGIRKLQQQMDQQQQQDAAAAAAAAAAGVGRGEYPAAPAPKLTVFVGDS